MSYPEMISNDYNLNVKKKIYELISLTSFYYDEMDWSLHNIRYYYKNIKYIILIYIIMFFEYLLCLAIIILFVYFIWNI